MADDAHGIITTTDKNIQIWKRKKLIKSLETARGNGRGSMISLIVPPRDTIARLTQMLRYEFATASTNQNTVIRESALRAITSAQQRLDHFNIVPHNGLVLYTGTTLTHDGGQQNDVTVDFEPFTPINDFLYICSDKFVTEPLDELLEYSDDGKKIGMINQGTGKCVFGVDDTLKALGMGAVETLIVWEDLDMTRCVMKNSTSGEIIIKHLNKEQETDQSNYRDESSGAELEVEEKMELLEWFAAEYTNFGCTLEFVTNKTQEGSQFCTSFGGIGGILRLATN